jgi:hypothetical protein
VESIAARKISAGQVGGPLAIHPASDEPLHFLNVLEIEHLSLLPYHYWSRERKVGSVEEMVRRMAAAVAPGGTLFVVGHQSIDPAAGDPTPAAGQVQVSLDTVTPALDTDHWELIVAENRPRAAAHSGVDAIIRARRRL